MKKYIPEISLFVLFAFLNMLTGCHYYMVNSVHPTTGDNSVVNDALSKQKYFILHQGNKAWQMSNIEVNEDKQELTCNTSQLPGDHLYYMSTKAQGVTRYKPSRGNPTYEVHIYVSEYAKANDSLTKVPISAIQKIDVYDKAVGATTASYVFSILGAIVGAFVILIVIILLTKSSCPFVYTSEGIAYHFTGEMFGGAIYSPLERDDYMPLPGFEPANNEYKLKISNELLERQYTDLAELMVVQHPVNSKVIIDKNGNLQTILSPVSPITAYTDNQADYAKSLASVDSSSYLFNEDGLKQDAISSMTMSFNKPANCKKAKLVLNAKNSLWLDYTYGKFNELFGTSFDKFSKKKKKTPAEQMNAWQMSQGIPLSVYVETEKGWQFVDCFNSVGPLASRDLVMPIDLSAIKGDKVQIRLQCGFMFWEVDYAALDFSENLPVQLTRLNPASAIDEKGHDVAQLLNKTDKKYLIQPEVGNEVVIKYTAPVSQAGMKQTAFLHSRGYYEYIREYKNKPDIAYLKSFRQEGAFTRFSKDNYMKFVSDKKLIANALNESNGK